jgi:hypothetical protein
MIPGFMRVAFTYAEKDKLAWTFEPGKCFAYKGFKRMGAIEKYECGVLYRIECWLDNWEYRSLHASDRHMQFAKHRGMFGRNTVVF